MAVMKSDDAIAEYVRKIASLGGRRRAQKLSAKRRTEIARKAARARWGRGKR